ncbi:MAG: alpha/beta hydrolase [Myxococcota bacterium]
MQRSLFLGLALCAAACSTSEPTPTPDSGPTPDAGEYDAGVVDAADSDAGARPDSGPMDAGFEDPTVIGAGISLVNDIRTFVEVRGTKTSTMPPLFVLHRGPAPAHDYLPPLLQDLVPGRLVVYYDMRGTGRSGYGNGTQSSTISTRIHIEDFGKVVEFVGTNYQVDVTKIDILGHEYGGAIGFRYAALHPAQVERLVVVNPFPADIDQYALFRGEIETRLTGNERLRYNTILNRPECWGSMDTCFNDIWSIVGPHYLCDQNRDLFSQIVMRYGSARTEYFYIEHDLRFSSYDWRSILPMVQAETTILTGECDPIPAQTADDYAAGIPNATRMALPHSGQYPMIEAHAEFINAVAHALRR